MVDNPSLFVRKVLHREKLDLTWTEEGTESWILNEGKNGSGLKLVEEATRILNDSKHYSRNKLCVMLLISQKNWQLANLEVSKLEKEVEKLKKENRQIQNQLNMALSGRR